MIKDLWYKNAIVYCLSVGTYMDSNGDGVGDFEGWRGGWITSRAWRHHHLADALPALARARQRL
ncbi:hypothetical protein ACFQU7_15130 [Pseudoroseomonas wenyumeiae]